MSFDSERSVFEPEPPEAPRDMVSRAINAALLDRRTFRDIKEDPAGTMQVYGLVAAAAAASFIGSVDNPGAAVSNAVLTVAGWLIYAHIAWFMRSYVFDTIHAEAARPDMLRVVGIAYGPSLFRISGIIPGIGGLIWAVTTIWLLVAIVFGLKSTLAFENYWPAVGIIVLGAFLNAALSAIVFGIV